MSETRPGVERDRPRPEGPQASVHPAYEPPLSITLPALLRAGRDKDFRRLIHALLVSTGRLARCRAAFGKPLGLTGAQYSVLMAAAHLQGGSGVSIRAIADYLNVAAAHVTAEVGKITAAGLLAKSRDSTDRRAVAVRLTPAGESALEQLGPLLRDINDMLFAGVSAEEFRVLAGFFDKFATNSERAVQRLGDAERAERRRAQTVTHGDDHA